MHNKRVSASDHLNSLNAKERNHKKGDVSFSLRCLFNISLEKEGEKENNKRIRIAFKDQE